jgi:hypothetical protein
VKIKKPPSAAKILAADGDKNIKMLPAKKPGASRKSL